MTNAEYDSSVQALFETPLRPSVEFGFPPDSRQGPANAPAGPAFTVNEAQRVDPVLADKLDTAALALAAEARQNGTLLRLAPCAAGQAEEVCAAEFVRSFGQKAYHRSVFQEEVDALVVGTDAPYHVAADGYSYEDGIEQLARIIVQMPSFLYLTELGEGGGTEPVIAMTEAEIAAALSYLLTAGPPDSLLLEAASAGILSTEDGREAEARRLLRTDLGRARVVQIVREWLGIAEVARRDKALSVYPDYPEVSHSMEEESKAFIEEVLENSTGTWSELLSADWTIADDALAAVYGVPSAGPEARTSLASTGRRGILNQGAFLSVFATNDGSHPVFRGVALLRRIACLDVPDPGALGVVVSLPPGDGSITTRERFARHSSDPECAQCHNAIDPFGFALEGYDGMGRARDMENGLPIDTSVDVALSSDFDGSYSTSADLMQALSQSDVVRTCMARQLFRSTAAKSGASTREVEDAFIATWQALPEDQQDKLEEVLIAFASSPLFIQRRTEP